jgi:F-type H+-transporting ATPase subunit b
MLSVNAIVFVTFVLVWILAFVLTKVFFKPLARILAERSSRIETAKTETEAALKAYDDGLRRVEDELKKARSASAEIWDQAELEALKEKSRLVQEIQAECRTQVENARRELEQRVEELKKEIDGRTDEIAADIERRILN